MSIPGTCFCGHEEDEHEEIGECLVEGCLCVLYEEGEPEDDRD